MEAPGRTGQDSSPSFGKRSSISIRIFGPRRLRSGRISAFSTSLAEEIVLDRWACSRKIGVPGFRGLRTAAADGWQHHIKLLSLEEEEEEEPSSVVKQTLKEEKKTTKKKRKYFWLRKVIHPVTCRRLADYVLLAPSSFLLSCAPSRQLRCGYGSLVGCFLACTIGFACPTSMCAVPSSSSGWREREWERESSQELLLFTFEDLLQMWVATTSASRDDVSWMLKVCRGF